MKLCFTLFFAGSRLRNYYHGHPERSQGGQGRADVLDRERGGETSPTPVASRSRVCSCLFKLNSTLDADNFFTLITVFFFFWPLNMKHEPIACKKDLSFRTPPNPPTHTHTHTKTKNTVPLSFNQTVHQRDRPRRRSPPLLCPPRR